MEDVFNTEVFVERLNSLVKNSQLPITKLSKEVGFTSASLSRYLSGERFPELKCASMIAKYFNVSLDWMCGLTDYQMQNYSEDLQKVIRLYPIATKSDKAVIHTLLSKYSPRD